MKKKKKLWTFFFGIFFESSFSLLNNFCYRKYWKHITLRIFFIQHFWFPSTSHLFSWLHFFETLLLGHFFDTFGKLFGSPVHLATLLGVLFETLSLGTIFCDKFGKLFGSPVHLLQYTLLLCDCLGVVQLFLSHLASFWNNFLSIWRGIRHADADADADALVQLKKWGTESHIFPSTGKYIIYEKKWEDKVKWNIFCAKSLNVYQRKLLSEVKWFNQRVHHTKWWGCSAFLTMMSWWNLLEVLGGDGKLESNFRKSAIYRWM